MSPKPKVVVICGPTGVGKTTLSIAIASRFNGEIIGADSMQIYRYMDIGTAKPTKTERSRIPHHMIDIIDPDEPFDAVKYARTAGGIIVQNNQCEMVSFVVGGTGLYIKALIHGLFEEKTSDPVIREEYKTIAAQHGTQHLHEQLSTIDPIAAQKLHPHDTYRIIRALEVHRLTGKSISEYHRRHGFSERRYDVLKIGLNMVRSLLYERIDRRVKHMMASGFVEEVNQLLHMGYSKDLKSMQSIGYKHVVDYIQNRLSLEDATRMMKRDTRRYAKRQFTWFRADPEMMWFDSEQIEIMIQKIESFLVSGRKQRGE